MIFRRMLLALALIGGYQGGWTASCLAQPTPAEVALEGQVQHLLRELDAPTLARRNAAEQQLVLLGTAALPWLPENDEHLASEARERLQRVRQRLQQSAAATATPHLPPMIQLDQADTLQAALAVLQAASGIRFDHPLSDDTPITPVATALTFWHAVDHVLDEASMDVDLLGGRDDAMRLRPRAPDRPRRVDSAAYAGWFRLEPTSITSRRSLRRPDASALHLDIEISWPPSQEPLSISLETGQLVAKLDDGQSIRSASDFGTIDLTPRRSIAASDLHLELQSPAGSPNRIESLAGRFKVVQAGPVQRLEFSAADMLSDPPSDDRPVPDSPPARRQAATRQSAAAVDVALERIRPNGELTEWVLAIEFTRPDLPLDSLRSSLLTNPVYVLDEQGDRHDHLGYQLLRQNADGLGISYLFDLGESVQGAKLCYETSATVITHEYDFQIQEIPLP